MYRKVPSYNKEMYWCTEWCSLGCWTQSCRTLQWCAWSSVIIFWRTETCLWTFKNMIVRFLFSSIYRHLMLKKDNTISEVLTLMWYVTGFHAFFSFIGSKISLESAAVPQWCSQSFSFSWPNTARKFIQTFSVYFSALTRIIFIYWVLFI